MIAGTIGRIRSDAVGSDGISLRMLKNYIVMHYIMPILEHIFNFFLMNGVFPAQWKSALVCPIPKVRNPTTLQHYRPISILPTMSKVLERIVCGQIRAYLEDAGLYDQYQSAYRSNYSTQTCLIRMLDEVRQAANGRMITVSVFFDFSKAFDKVDHSILIRKLKSLNFSDSTVCWISSYLGGADTSR